VAVNQSSSVDSRLCGGFEWLVSRVVEQFDALNDRVSEDVEQRRQREARERQERLARVTAIRLQRYFHHSPSVLQLNLVSLSGSSTSLNWLG